MYVKVVPIKQQTLQNTMFVKYFELFVSDIKENKRVKMSSSGVKQQNHVQLCPIPALLSGNSL